MQYGAKTARSSPASSKSIRTLEPDPERRAIALPTAFVSVDASLDGSLGWTDDGEGGTSLKHRGETERDRKSTGDLRGSPSCHSVLPVKMIVGG